MLIKLVKTVVVEVDTDDPAEALDMVDDLDAEGALEFYADYYDAETLEQLN